MNKRLRKLNATEMISWIISQQYPHSLAVVAHVKGYMSFENFKTVLKQLQHENLMLRVNTEHTAEGVFLTEITGEIPLSLYEQDNHWQHIVLRELRSSFQSNNSPLARMVVNFTTDGVDLIFVFHHLIADGLGGIWFIRDFLTMLSHETITTSESQLDLSGEYINHFPHCKVEKIANDHENITEFVHFQMHRRETEQMARYCKRHSINIHSAFASAACLALYSVQDKAQVELRFSAPVNLRALYHLDIQNFSALSSWIDDQIPIDSSILAPDLAARVFSKTKTQLAENLPQKNIMNLYEFLNYKSTNEIVTQLTSTQSTAVLSNLGRLQIETRYPAHTLLGIHIVANCQHYLAADNTFLLVVTNLHDTNFFNLCYSAQAVGRNKAEKIVRAFTQIINENFVCE